MGIELFYEAPLAEGRLARSTGRDQATQSMAAPDRMRDTGNFATVFHKAYVPGTAILPPPESSVKGAATDSIAEAGPSEAPPKEAGDTDETGSDSTRPISDAHSLDGLPDQNLDGPAPFLVLAPDNSLPTHAPGLTTLTQIVPEDGAGKLPHSNETRPSMSELRQTDPLAATAPPVPNSAFPPQATGIHNPRALPRETIVAAPAAFVAEPANAAAPLPAGLMASSLTPANGTSLPRLAGSAAASRFNASLAEGTTLQPAPKPVQRLPPSARSAAGMPWPEDRAILDIPETMAKEGGAVPAVISTSTPAVSLPVRAALEPQFPVAMLSAAPVEAGLARSEQRRLVAHVGTQLVQAATTNGPNTELQLNPVELGRVRLSLQVIDSTITVAIMADRPETADLIRRYVDTLAQEFRALGYQDVNVSVGQRQAGAEQADLPRSKPDESGATTESAIDQSPTLANRPGLSASGGLDLRL